MSKRITACFIILTMMIVTILPITVLASTTEYDANALNSAGKARSNKPITSTNTSQIYFIYMDDAEGGYIVLDIDVPKTGMYDITCMTRNAASGRATFDFSILSNNDPDSATPVPTSTGHNANQGSGDWKTHALATECPLTAGSYKFKFTITNIASARLPIRNLILTEVFPDQHIKEYNANEIAGQNRVNVSNDGVRAAISTSTGANILQADTNNPKIGSWIEYVIPVEKAGWYDISTFVRRMSDRGICSFTVNRKHPLSEEHDLYNSNASDTTIQLAKACYLRAGDNYFRFTVTGKRSSSANYLLAFYSFKIVETFSPGGVSLDFYGYTADNELKVDVVTDDTILENTMLISAVYVNDGTELYDVEFKPVTLTANAYNGPYNFTVTPPAGDYVIRAMLWDWNSKKPLTQALKLTGGEYASAP